MKQRIAIITLTLILGVAVTACVSVKYPQRTQYLLKIKTPKSQLRTGRKIVEVVNTAIVPQFAGLSFVYRTSELNYSNDYYNIFFIAPEQQIQQAIVRSLQASGCFSYVATGVTPLAPSYVLQSKVLSLYADYRNSARPCAVVAINFTLTTAGPRPRLKFSKTFTEAIVLPQKTSSALVRSWSLGVARILTRFNLMLEQKNLKT